MALRSRPMQPNDLRECVQIIAGNPAVGRRYGNAIVDLPKAWLRLLAYEAKSTLILEEVEGAVATICFVGVSVFADDAFVREIKTAPLFWVGPELLKRILRGDPPLLSERELREANSPRRDDHPYMGRLCPPGF